MKLTLTTLILLACLSVMGQTVKIGNITISEATAQKYFLDCYNHPDLVRTKSESDFYPCENCSIPYEAFEQAKVAATEYNNDLQKSAVGQKVDTIYVAAHIDTLYNGEPTCILRLNGFPIPKSAKITYENIKASSYTDWKGYLIPRKPSEIDFIKWSIKQNTK